MKKLKLFLLLAFFLGSGPLLYSGDCTSNSDCGESDGSCTCEGRYNEGKCKFNTDDGECCVCIA